MSHTEKDKQRLFQLLCCPLDIPITVVVVSNYYMFNSVCPKEYWKVPIPVSQNPEEYSMVTILVLLFPGE